MTTIINPAGSPTIVYNKSGTTIVSVTANGETQADATSIPRLSGVTVANVTLPDSSNLSVKLPSDAEIGDVVEVYGPGFNVFPESGSTIVGGFVNDKIVPLQNGLIFRKLGPTLWGAA